MSALLDEELVRDWDRMNRIGLNPKITSAKKYLIAVAKGAKQAERLLLKKGEVIPTLETIREVHFVMFKNIHPWAGNFRREGEEVRAGDLICTLSTEIESELKTLNQAKMLLKAEIDLTKFERASYIKTLSTAQGEGDLLPLSNLIQKNLMSLEQSPQFSKPLKQSHSQRKRLSL